MAPLQVCRPGCVPFIIAPASTRGLQLLLVAELQLGEFSEIVPLRGHVAVGCELVSVVVLGHELPIGELVGILACPATDRPCCCRRSAKP